MWEIATLALRLVRNDSVGVVPSPVGEGWDGGIQTAIKLHNN